MQVKKTATAGTMESSDIMISVIPKAGKGVDVMLTSSVSKQFGNEIKSVILSCAERLKIDGVQIVAVDKGALDCVIKARTETALYRACESHDYQWEA
ncbi:MAG: citrate lyase acyl carrier protein [Sphaerochaetaceae bacterium]